MSRIFGNLTQTQPTQSQLDSESNIEVKTEVTQSEVRIRFNLKFLISFFQTETPTGQESNSAYYGGNSQLEPSTELASDLGTQLSLKSEVRSWTD